MKESVFYNNSTLQRHQRHKWQQY